MVLKGAYNRFVTTQAVIPLYPIARWGNSNTKSKDDEDSGRFRSIKIPLRTIPTDPNSQKFDRYFLVWESGTPEEFCRWTEDLQLVFNGLNQTTGPEQINMTRQLLEGEALDTFNDYLSREGVGQTVANRKKALRKVAASFFPTGAVSKQVEYLRYKCKKPNALTASETRERGSRLLRWLKHFPSDNGDRTDEVTMGTTLQGEQSEMYFRLLPNDWKKKMEGTESFDYHSKTLKELEEFAMRLETAEGISTSKDENLGNTGRKKGNRGKADSRADGDPKRDNRNNGDNHSKDCKLHGKGCGHSDRECKVWIDHAQKVRAQREAQAKKFPYKKSQNKTWKRSKDGDKRFSKNEVLKIVKAYQKRADNQEFEQEMHHLEEETARMEIDQQHFDGAIDDLDKSDAE